MPSRLSYARRGPLDFYDYGGGLIFFPTKRTWVGYIMAGDEMPRRLAVESFPYIRRRGAAAVVISVHGVREPTR